MTKLEKEMTTNQQLGRGGSMAVYIWLQPAGCNGCQTQSYPLANCIFDHVF